MIPIGGVQKSEGGPNFVRPPTCPNQPQNRSGGPKSAKKGPKTRKTQIPDEWVHFIASHALCFFRNLTLRGWGVEDPFFNCPNTVRFQFRPFFQKCPLLGGVQNLIKNWKTQIPDEWVHFIASHALCFFRNLTLRGWGVEDPFFNCPNTVRFQFRPFFQNCPLFGPGGSESQNLRIGPKIDKIYPTWDL